MDIVLKRVMAYILDMLIVTIFLSLFVGQRFINPYVDEFNESYNAYMELIEGAQEDDIDTDSKEYKDNVANLYYDVNKYKVVSSSISLVVTFLYFGVLQWGMKGQTLGKKIMKIRVVSNKEDKDVSIWNYSLRTIILNNTIFSLILIVGVYIFNAQKYYDIMGIVSYLQLLVTTIILLMVVLRKDFRGLHDFVAGTKVIDLNPVLVQEMNKDEIEEKKVIETKEVSDVKDETKPKTKTASKKTKSKTKTTKKPVREKA